MLLLEDTADRVQGMRRGSPRFRRVAGLLLLIMSLAVSRVGSASAQDHGELVALLKENVFQIKVFDAEGKHISSGSGFFIRHGTGADAPRGIAANAAFAVTNYHVIDDAHTVVAVRESDKREFPVSLMATRPGFDHALVRVDFGSTGFMPRGLPYGDVLPVEGTEVWAIVYPLGFTVTRGVVSGLRRWEDLKPGSRNDIDRACVWIQIDASINSGNSGGPVVDTQGNVIGVSTWFYTSGESQGFASSAIHIKDLLSASGDGPIPFPITTRPRDERPADPSGTQEGVPDTSGLKLAILAKDRSDSDLLARAKSLEAAMSCTGCAGVGTIQVRKRTGQRRSGGVATPIYSNVTTTCSVCSGRGIGTFDRASNALVQLSRAVGRTLPPREKSSTRMAIVCRTIREGLLAAGELHPAMNGQGIGVLTRASADAPESVYFTAQIVSQELVVIHGRDDLVLVLLARIENHDRHVLLVDPLWNEGRTGSNVMVFGPCVGLHADSEQRYPVVQAPLIVAY